MLTHLKKDSEHGEHNTCSTSLVNNSFKRTNLLGERTELRLPEMIRSFRLMHLAPLDYTLAMSPYNVVIKQSQEPTSVHKIIYHNKIQVVAFFFFFCYIQAIAK